MGGQPDDIVCYEIGSGAMPPWEGSRTTLRDDWGALETQAACGVIELDVQGNQTTIRGGTHVGLVMLPSGRRLIIRSKVSSLELLEWLVFLGKFPRLTAWLTGAGVSAGEDWHKCIARLFLFAMEVVTRQHLRRDYVPVYLHEPSIRGRIVTKQLASRWHRLPRVPQVQRRRTLDTQFNGVLATALDRLPMMLSDDRQASPRLANLREQWASIRRATADPLAAAMAAQWASPAGYHIALQLARMILTGAVVDPASGMGGRAFTMSLSGLWEDALRRMCDLAADTTGWKRKPDFEVVRRWDDPVGRDDSRRWVRADILMERNGIRWVLDAKYKRDFGDESRLDRFQMCAYAVAFDADRVSLVYPTGADGAPALRTLLSTTIGSKRLRIDSFDLPMSAGPEACTAALAALAGKVRANSESNGLT